MDQLKRQVFLAIPFDRKFAKVTETIREVCFAYSFKLIRVDEKHSPEEITNDIYNEIQNSPVFIADLTENRPNVLFELGYAKGRDKEIICITRDLEDLPFDLRNFRTIEYSIRGKGLEKLFEELDSKLEYLVKQKSILDGWDIVGWEKHLRKHCTFGSNWKFNRKQERSFQQLYKNSWIMPDLFIHFEFWTEMEDLLDGDLYFMLEIEKKEKKAFIEFWKKSLTKEQRQPLHKKGIEIYPKARKQAIAYKHYKCSPELKDFCECVLQAYQEFEFLISITENILESYLKEDC